MNDIPNQDSFAGSLLDAAEAETLSGDIRDALLTHVRSIKVPWAMLAEDEQAEKIAAITSMAEHAVRIAAGKIAHQGFEHVIVTTGKWTVKDGIKLEVNSAASLENINALAQHGAGAAILVLVDAAQFFGERAPAKPDKDQPDLIKDEA